MLEPERDEERVVGELFELEDVETCLARLDEYEHATLDHGRLFERRRQDAQLEDGSRVEAWVFFYRGEVPSRKRIVSGDYLRR